MPKRPVNKRIKSSFKSKSETTAAVPVPVPSVEAPLSSAQKSKRLFLIMLIGFCATLATFPGLSWLFPFSWFPSSPLPATLLLVFWIGLVFAIKYTPIELGSSPAESSFTLERPFLWGLLLLAIILRLHYPVDIFSPGWCDSYIEATGAFSVIDKREFGDSFFMGRAHGLQPLSMWSYILLWWIVPSIKILVAQKIVCTFYFVITLLFLYLAGVEIGNSRAGVFAVILGLFSKPLWEKSLCCMHAGTPPAVFALILWLFLRTMRKPSWFNFILFGLALAIPPYSYQPIRVLVPYYILAALVWLYLSRPSERPNKPSQASVIALCGFIFILFVFYLNILFTGNNWITRSIDISGPFFPCLLIFAFLALATRVFSDAENPLATSWRGWILAVWVCIIVTYPIYSHSYIQDQLRSHLNAEKHYQFLSTLRFMFDQSMGGGDREDMGLPGDSFFSYVEIALGALGLALAFAKPNLVRIFLMLAFFMGLAPYALDGGLPHSLRLIACVSPFLLLGGLGADYLWQRFQNLSISGSRIKTAVLIVLCGLSVWAFHQRVIVDWAENLTCKDSVVYQGVRQDQSQGYRVFLGHSFDWHTSFALYESHPVDCLLPSNTIYLSETEKPTDVSIFLGGDDEETPRTKKAVSDAYPNAHWEDLLGGYHKMGHLAWRCRISSADIQNTPAGLFHFQTIPTGSWKRTVFNSEDGLRPSFRTLVDYVSDPKAPFPDGMRTDNRFITFQREIRVSQTGKFHLTCKGHRLLRVKLDGETVGALNFHGTRNFGDNDTKSCDRLITLKSGVHQIEITTYLDTPDPLPDVLLNRNGETPRAIWNTFDY